MTSSMERIWLNEYLKCWNATEAARRAGYKWPGRIGTRKLSKFEDRIKKRLDARAMEADEALFRLAEIARGEWGKYIDENGNVEIGRLVADDKTYLVAEIRDTKYGRSYKFCDMQAAIVKILEHHGAFVNRHDITSGGERITIEYVNDWRNTTTDPPSGPTGGTK